MASKKLIVPVMTNEHFQHQQQQFDKKPIRFQLLDHQGLKMNSLTTFAWLNYIKFAAQVNEMSTLFDDDGKGGYEILSDAAVQAYNIGKEPDPPLGPNPTLEEQEKWNKSLTRMANSTAALKADKVERRKRSDEAGRFLSEIMLPSIKPEAIALFTSKWATQSDSDHFANMMEIMDYAKSFLTKYGNISESLTRLLDEIPIAQNHDDMHKVLAQFESFQAMQKEYLTVENAAGERVPKDPNYPAKTDIYIMERLRKKISEREPVKDYRTAVSTYIRNERTLPQLTTNIRRKLQEYEPNDLPVVPVRAHYAPSSNDQPQPVVQPIRANHVDGHSQPPSQMARHEEAKEDYYTEPFHHLHQYEEPDQSWMDLPYQGEQTVHANVGRPLENQYQPPAQRVRMEQPQQLVPCQFNITGNCRYGNNCRFQHDQAVQITMTPAQAQQWQYQQMVADQRHNQAMSNYQQGSSPSMHPTGAYHRPPPPTEPYNQAQQNSGRGTYGGRYGGRGGRGPHGGR